MELKIKLQILLQMATIHSYSSSGTVTCMCYKVLYMIAYYVILWLHLLHIAPHVATSHACKQLRDKITCTVILYDVLHAIRISKGCFALSVHPESVVHVKRITHRPLCTLLCACTQHLCVSKSKYSLVPRPSKTGGVEGLGTRLDQAGPDELILKTDCVPYLNFALGSY